jgi:hypothetical protein
MFVDAGDFTGDLTVPGQKQTDAILDAMNRLGYQVSALGQRDLGPGWDAFAERRARAKFPFVSANLVYQDSGEPVVDPFVVQKVALRDGSKAREVRIAFTGLSAANPAFLKNGAGGRRIVTADPMAAAKTYIPQMRAKADVVVVLAALDLDAARNLARGVKDIDLILGGLGAIQSRSDDFPEDSLIGKTRLQYVGDQGKNLGEIRIGFTDKRAIQSVWRSLIGLTSEWPDEPQLLALQTQTKDAVNEYNKSQATSASPFLAPSTPGAPVAGAPAGVAAAAGSTAPAYTGSDRCMPCHQEEFGIWKRSTHARAFDTLVQNHQDFNPNCVGCHSIGFGKPNGFLNSETTPGLQHVGCESCHGPSSRHPDSMLKGYGVTTTTACRVCHTQENSPDFDPAVYIPKIKHWKEAKAGH